MTDIPRVDTFGMLMFDVIVSLMLLFALDPSQPLVSCIHSFLSKSENYNGYHMV